MAVVVVFVVAMILRRVGGGRARTAGPFPSAGSLTLGGSQPRPLARPTVNIHYLRASLVTINPRRSSKISPRSPLADSMSQSTARKPPSHTNGGPNQLAFEKRARAEADKPYIPYVHDIGVTGA